MKGSPMNTARRAEPSVAMTSAALDEGPLRLRPLSPHTGVEVLDVDLGEPISEDACRQIRRALCDRGMVLFRGQTLEPRHHLAFARRFGRVPETEFLETEPGFPEIGYIRKSPGETRNIGGNWHSDHSFDPTPPLGSVLLARDLPEAGGDTLFANMGAAHDSLSEGLKASLEGLSAVHEKAQSMRADPRPDRAVDDAGRQHFQRHAHRACVHPVVRTHPETGRRILFVNPTYTVRFDGWTEAESQPLLAYLFAQATRPENTCRVRWEPGMLAFWDNRCAIHYALNDYHGHHRLMHRCVVYES